MPANEYSIWAARSCLATLSSVFQMAYGVAMRIICDSHILLFWANAPARLSSHTADTLEKGLQAGMLTSANISLLELALLHESGRLPLPENVSPLLYISRLLESLRLKMITITTEITLLSRCSMFQRDDPADHIIGATVLHGGWPLIATNVKLCALPELNCIW